MEWLHINEWLVHDPIYIYIQTKSVATMIKELEVLRL